jgi:glycosyltransferase involved in cell wall biosynthesis
MKSLFVYLEHDLEAEVPGGIQLCSRQFLEIVEAASSSTSRIAVSISRNWVWRVRRRLRLGSYLLYDPRRCAAGLADALRESQPTHVFLNKAELLRLTPVVKRLRPQATVVLMSHGNQSGDDLYEISGSRGRRNCGLGRLSGIWQLGLDLATESFFRHRSIDAVCVMSPEEEALEPRFIRPEFLEWKPIPGRVGYVGTLDHTPNQVAVEEVCEEISRRGPAGLELRLVGRPERVGHQLSARYPFIHYMGGLNDGALKSEASTWSLFLTPVFWLARGASMKLGRALAWGLPVLSTRAGARGYDLSPGALPLVADDPSEFVATIGQILRQPGEPSRLREEGRRVALGSGDVQALAKQLKAKLS